MGLTSVVKDPEALTMTVTSEWDVEAERAWQLWADPRQLERWWGPPTWPATVLDHDLVPGGRVSYVMTGPDGDRAGGMWHVDEVDPPSLLVLRDQFANDDGSPNEAMPTTVMRVTIAESPAGSTMTVTSTFPSLAAMEQLVGMGMEEGMLAAMSQIEAVLAD